jgi:hypothetical protein
MRQERPFFILLEEKITTWIYPEAFHHSLYLVGLSCNVHHSFHLFCWRTFDHKSTHHPPLMSFQRKMAAQQLLER